MTERRIKELLFSLAWYDASNYHNQNVKEILAIEFPGTDFTAALAEFETKRNPQCLTIQLRIDKEIIMT